MIATSAELVTQLDRLEAERGFFERELVSQNRERPIDRDKDFYAFLQNRIAHQTAEEAAVRNGKKPTARRRQ